MKQLNVRGRNLLCTTLWFASCLALLGCGASLPALARSTGAKVLDCPELEIRGELESKAAGSERWLVGCEMRTAELICSQKECRVQSWRDEQKKSAKTRQ